MHTKFEDVTELGRGASATVYRAVRRDNKRAYAVKVFKSTDIDAQDRVNLVREVLLLSSLDHAHIVQFKEAFVGGNDNVNVVMEVMQGGTLAQFINNLKQRRALLPETSVWALWLQLASAVHYLHSRRICHRDLKPSNIVFASKDSSRLKVLDFGLSKLMKTQLTCSQVGTPLYAAPEVLSWQPYGFSCDVWSLGCILYELAALQPAFDASNNWQLRYKVMKGGTSPLDGRYSQQLSDTIALMLEPDASKRITMDQMLQLPHVACLLRELQQRGLVGGPGKEAAAAAEEEAELARALDRLERTPAEEEAAAAAAAAAAGTACGQQQPWDSQESRRMADMLCELFPAPRYSKEAPAASMPVQAALASSFYSSGSAPCSPLAAAAGSSSSSSSMASPAEQQRAAQAAALAALGLESPFASRKQATACAAPAGVQVHVHAEARSSPPSLSSGPEPAAAEPAAPAVCPAYYSGRVPKLHPKYAALVAAESARFASMTGSCSDSPSAPASPQPSDVASPAGCGRPHAASSRLGRAPAPVPAAAAAAPRKAPRATPFARTLYETLRPYSAAGARAVDGSQLSPAEYLRATVAACLQAEDELLLRQITERISRLATPASSAGPTPRTVERAEQAALLYRQLARVNTTEVYQVDEQQHMQVQYSSPSCPALCPSAAPSAASQANGAEQEDQPQPVSEAASGAPAAAPSEPAPAHAAQPKPRRKWWQFGPLRRHHAKRSSPQRK